MTYRKIYFDHINPDDAPDDPLEFRYWEMDTARDFNAEFAQWLPSQPPDLWLGLMRETNWDVAEGMFRWMISQPDCDRAIAAWVFWNSQPDYYLRQERPDRKSIPLLILENSRRRFYQTSELELDRFELIRPVQRYLKTRREIQHPPAFLVPKELIGPFYGRRADDMSDIEPAAKAALDIRFGNGGGRVLLSVIDQREHVEKIRKAEGSCLDLPPLYPGFETENAHLDEEAYIEAVYGSQADYEKAVKKRQKSPGLMDKLADMLEEQVPEKKALDVDELPNEFWNWAKQNPIYAIGVVATAVIMLIWFAQNL